MKRSFIREILESIDENTISFAGGLPSEELFPSRTLKKCASKVLKNKSIYQYSLSNGIKELRQKIAQKYCSEGFETTEENILITTGSQQGMYIISKFFENKIITIEKPSYLGAINIFKLNHLKMENIDLELDGIKTKEFKKSFAKSKLAYLIPDFQNPTSTTYSQQKRDEVAKIVKKHDGMLIEDSPYSELFFDKKFQSISSQIPNNSLHLGSFSKTLSPSLRLGWIRASKELIDSLIIIKESIDLHSSGISQYILNEYLKDEKAFEKHIQTIRDDYESKMNYFCKCLDKYLPNFKYIKPKGGMFVYGSFENIDSFKLVYEAMKEKVLFVPGNQFYENKDEIRGEIRFNYTNSNKKQMKKGIKTIAQLVKK